MNLLEIHHAIDIEYWIELTEKKDLQDMRWLFHPPANNISGTYRLEYLFKGRATIEDGNYELEIREGQVVIKIGDDAEFYLTLGSSDRTMTWHSLSRETIRNFKRADA